MFARRLLLTTVLAAVVGVSFQGSRGLYETTEGRYAEVGREMVETGDWWTPTLDYEPHWTKPPLTYWMIAAGIRVLGPNEWGARVGNGLLLVALALASAWLGRLLWDRETGAVAGLVFATSLFPVVATATISTDALLALWELLAVAAYWAGALGPPERARRWSVAMWGFLGLAFLTKGPPGLLALLVLLVYHGVARKRGWPRGNVVSVWGLGIFLVVGLGWYLDEVIRTPGLLGYFLGEEVVARVATDQFGRNPQWYKPPLIYGPPLLLGLGGWLFVLWRARRRSGTQGPAWWRDRLLGSSRAFFLALWVVLPVVVLSLSRSRLPLYVLPVFPAFVLAAARGLQRWEASGEGPWPPARTFALLFAAALVAIKGLAPQVTSASDMRPVYRAVEAARAENPGGPVEDPGAAGPGSVIAVDEAQLYGLQFYLRGTMGRAVTEASPGDDRPTLSAALEALFRSGDAGGVLLVSRHREVTERILASLAVDWRTVASPGRYSVWRVRRRPSPRPPGMDR